MWLLWQLQSLSPRSENPKGGGLQALLAKNLLAAAACTGLFGEAAAARGWAFRMARRGFSTLPLPDQHSLTWRDLTVP